MTWILKLAIYNETIASFCGLISNGLLIYLVLTVNKANMKHTNRILLQNCIIDILLSISTMLTGAHVVNINNIYYYICGSLIRPYNFVYCSATMWSYATLVVLSIHALPVPFYIRYLALCRNKIASAKNIIFAYLLVLPGALCVFGLMVWLYPGNSEHYQKYIPATLTQFWLDEYPAGPTFVAKEMGYQLIIFEIFIFISASISYSLVLFFSIKITRHLKSHASSVIQSHIPNKQLHLTLIVQAMVPLIIGNIPLLCMVIMITIEYENNYISVGLSSMLGWMPVVNPVAAMIIMTPYRRRIKEYLSIKSQHSTTTLTIHTSEIRS